MYLSITGQF